MSTRLVQPSKFLSLVLRHQPEAIGLALDAEGWGSVDDLLVGADGSTSELARAHIASGY